MTMVRMVLGVCALALVAGGMWLAALGDDSSGATVTSSADEAVATPALAVAGRPILATPVAPAEPAGAPANASPTAPGSNGATAAPAPTVEPAAPAPRVVRPGGPPVAPPPTPTRTVTDLPTMSASEVLALSRDVRLPSGKTFEACGTMGPEGEPWPFSMHLYYAGHGGWVVATHRGDASLSFDEPARTFRVDTLTRAGC